MARSRREALEKVVKMLRLARAAGTEAEAHTALSLAQKLMYAHGLEAHEVDESAESGAGGDGRETDLEPIEETMVDHASSRLGWREYLAAVVAENFRCAYILSQGKPSASSKRGVVRLVFVGRQLDVAAGTHAYRAAMFAGETLAETYAKDRDEAEREKARDAYLSGFLAGLDRRLRENIASAALTIRLDDAVLAHAQKLTNAGEAEGVGLPVGDVDALRSGFEHGFAYGDKTKRVRAT